MKNHEKIAKKLKKWRSIATKIRNITRNFATMKKIKRNHKKSRKITKNHEKSPKNREKVDKFRPQASLGWRGSSRGGPSCTLRAPHWTEHSEKCNSSKKRVFFKKMILRKKKIAAPREGEGLLYILIVCYHPNWLDSTGPFLVRDAEIVVKKSATQNPFPEKMRVLPRFLQCFTPPRGGAALVPFLVFWGGVGTY